METQEINYSSYIMTIEECQMKHDAIVKDLCERKRISVEDKKRAYRILKEITARKAYLQHLQDVIKIEIQRIRNGLE